MSYEFETDLNDHVLTEITTQIGSDCFFAIRFITKGFLYLTDLSCISKLEKLFSQKKIKFKQTTDDELLKTIETIGL